MYNIDIDGNIYSGNTRENAGDKGISLVANTYLRYIMSKFIQRRKSWADRNHIPTGYWGEVVGGIHILEKNRATVWEFRREGIEELQRIMISQYKSKGVRCTLFGIDDGKNIKYAVFVQNGWLIKVDENETP